MLPDGGWDNSWGTRTINGLIGEPHHDGCQPAYALLADRDPRFARPLTEIHCCCGSARTMGYCMGTAYVSHGVRPAYIILFAIARLDNVLDHGLPAVHAGMRRCRGRVLWQPFFKDIQTWLISVGGIGQQ